MDRARMDRVLIVGGSIAASTAAVGLRRQGYEGEVTVASEEPTAPYSRVPLSKGVLAKNTAPEDAALPALPADIELVLGHRAVSLDAEQRIVTFEDGTSRTYDGLIIATGARARRLAAPGQRGEAVIRTLDDARHIASRITGGGEAIVIGAGFLGMEVASTLSGRGMQVTVIDPDPPLERLLGPWLSQLITDSARDQGVRFIRTAGPVRLLGDPVHGVSVDGEEIEADLVITAAGDIPNVEWLADSGLPVRGGLLVDAHCRALPTVSAAGDVTVHRDLTGTIRRTPHWTNAVGQAMSAARALLDPTSAAHQTDHYYWTEQFGLDIKIAGTLPAVGSPEIVDGDTPSRRLLLQWRGAEGALTAATVNYRMPIVKLKVMARAVPAVV